VQSFVAKFKDEFVAKGKADEERRAREKAAPKSATPTERSELASAH
jgi:hypothetical protein